MPSSLSCPATLPGNYQSGNPCRAARVNVYYYYPGSGPWTTGLYGDAFEGGGTHAL